MPVELLAALQGELDHASKQLKAATARFNTALEVRYATRAAEARRACGKDTGTVRLVDGDYTVVADLPRCGCRRALGWLAAVLASGTRDVS